MCASAVRPCRPSPSVCRHRSPRGCYPQGSAAAQGPRVRAGALLDPAAGDGRRLARGGACGGGVRRLGRACLRRLGRRRERRGASDPLCQPPSAPSARQGLGDQGAGGADALHGRAEGAPRRVL
eukprot:4833736-Prymnesium_polylepis.2